MHTMNLESGEASIEHVTVIRGQLDGEANPYAQARTVERNDQFMFGPSIMVAPFYEKYATERQVQLPAGDWYDFYTGRHVGRQENITISAAQTGDRMPLFVKRGEVIPLLSRTISHTDQAYGCDLELRLYGNTKGSYELYEDDGKSFDYMRGNYSLRKIEVRKTQSGEFTYTEERTPVNGPSMFGKIMELKVMGSQ